MRTTLSALADPTRLQIVELLRRKPLPVGEIADRLRLQQPQASKRIYALQPEPFNELDEWLERYRDLMQDRMSRLEEIVEEMKRKERTR